LTIQRLETENNRRPDLILYVNGLPLVMIELKNATEKIKVGYDKNLQDYRHFFSWAKLKDTAVSREQKTREEVEAASKATNKRLSLKIFGEGLCHKHQNIRRRALS